MFTGVPRSLKNAFPWDHTMGLSLGPYARPRDSRLIFGSLESAPPASLLSRSGLEKTGGRVGPREPYVLGQRTHLVRSEKNVLLRSCQALHSRHAADTPPPGGAPGP